VRKPYRVAGKDLEGFGGGSYFALGGRSLFWSLEAPEIDRENVKVHFPEGVVDVLYDHVTKTKVKEGWYTKALRILANSPPGKTDYPKGQSSEGTENQITNAIDTLQEAIKKYLTDKPAVTPNGAEFAAGEDSRYYFPQNAYSTVDWLLDRILN
jgi:hypothetical protein